MCSNSLRSLAEEHNKNIEKIEQNLNCRFDLIIQSTKNAQKYNFLTPTKSQQKIISTPIKSKCRRLKVVKTLGTNSGQSRQEKVINRFITPTIKSKLVSKF